MVGIGFAGRLADINTLLCPRLLAARRHNIWDHGGQIEQVAAALPMRLKITHHSSLIPPAAPDRRAWC